MITKSFCSVCYHHVVLAIQGSPRIFSSAYIHLFFTMTGTPSLPPGLSGKDPLPPRPTGSPLPPLSPQTRQGSQPRPKTPQATPNPNIELFKNMVERTERANVRIHKLNALRKLRRLESQTAADVSDDEAEEPLPLISDFLSHSRSSPPACAPTPCPDAPGVPSPSLGSDLLNTISDHPGQLPRNVAPADDGSSHLLKSADWRALMSLDNTPPSALPKADYIDFSEIGPMFKTTEARKNRHELDLKTIPNALRQMAFYHVFIPLSMFTADSMNVIRDNIGDLYTKKKTSLSMGKYVLNSDAFPWQGDPLRANLFSSAQKLVEASLVYCR